MCVCTNNIRWFHAYRNRSDLSSLLFWFNAEDSVSSNDEHVPLPDVLPPQLADTPGLLLRSLGLAPPRPPATTASSSENPKPRARGGLAKKKKESTGQNPKSAETEATAPPRKRRKPAPDPKNWVALAYREKKKDEYIYYWPETMTTSSGSLEQ